MLPEPAAKSFSFTRPCRFAVMTLSLLFALSLSDRAVAADPPGILNHQGRIAVNGTNFDGAGRFKFALVSAAGDTSYWSNDDSSTTGGEPTVAVPVPVSQGQYAVLLGDAPMGAIPASVFADNADVRLRIWFSADGGTTFEQLAPDRRIASVGYALVAGGLAPGVTIPASAVVTPPPGMVLIPAGEFTMGDSVDSLSNAVPVSTTVSAFYMDANEVTLSQWQSVYLWALDQTPAYGFTNAGAGKSANHPVHGVNWNDCVKWCNARSEQAGKVPVYYTDAGFTTVYRIGEVPVFANWVAKGYRLPTEAEWEKAARGGQSGQRFPWGMRISQNLANYFGAIGTYSYDLGPDGYNSIGSVGGTDPATSPVGTFALNGYGLSDMAGNVLEWCWDFYGTPYAGGTDPHRDVGAARVFRGGAYYNPAHFNRTAQRFSRSPADAGYYWGIGFRTVLLPGQ